MSGELRVISGAQPASDEPLTNSTVNRIVAEATLKVLRGAITSRELAEGSITQAKLSETFVRTVVLQSGAATTAKFADGAVGTGKLHDDAVNKSKISADVAGINLAQAEDGSLTPTPDNITLEIGANGLQTKAGGVQTEHIRDGAVHGWSIEAGAVTDEKLGNDAATATKFAANSVAQSKLAAGAHGSHVLSSGLAATTSNTTANQLVQDTKEVTALAAKPLFVVAVVQFALQPSYAGGTATIRLCGTNGSSTVPGSELHGVEVTVPGTAFKWQTVVLVARWTANPLPTAYVQVTSELGTCTGVAFNEVHWRLIHTVGIA